MRGGYVRGGHSRAHNHLQRKEEKKVREEDWMIEGGAEEAERQGDAPKRSFRETVRGGKNPVTTVEGENGTKQGRPEPEKNTDEEARELPKKIASEVRLEKINGVYHFFLGENTLKQLRRIR
ncbi:hypothetical protein PIB30_053227 [Stylosanthes scabra]|uniref:Uncharacterized protein n=1 Tax=Stylosanthes scabra TaxID=79078 RepID=A0ABU6UIT7_9FABA|nr:hypothetical protein [Stylosanthes scabra]